MKNIQFKGAGLENFGGYNEEMSIEFENGKLILITGPNGIGKTTLFDCMSYSLYGRTTKGGTGEDVINNIAKKDCKSWTRFFIDNDEFLVERYVKYSKHGTTVYLFKNNNLIKKGHNEVVPYLEQIFMPYKLFINTLMFTQKVKDFFTDLTDSAQKEIFRMILLLNDYVTFQSIAGDKLKSEEEILTNLKNKIITNEKLIENINHQIISINEKKLEFEKNKKIEIDTITSSLNEIEETIKTYNLELEKYTILNLDLHKQQLQQYLSNTKNQYDSIESDIKSKMELVTSKRDLKESELRSSAKAKTHEFEKKLNDERGVYNNSVNKLKLEISQKENEINSEFREVINQCNIIVSDIQRLQSDLSEYSELSTLKEGTTCPTCKQILSTESYKIIQDKKDNIENELKELKNKKQNLEFTANEIKSKKLRETDEFRKIQTTDIESKYNQAKTEYSDNIKIVNQRLEEVLNTLSKLSKSDIEKIKNESDEKYKSLKTEIEKITNDIENIDSKINSKKTIEENISKLENNKSTLNGRLSEKRKSEFDDRLISDLNNKKLNIEIEIKSDKNSIPDIEKRITICEFWKKEGFSSSGIPSMLIDDSIPFMNTKITEYSEKIAGGRYIIKFDTLQATKDRKEFKDKINVEVYDSKTKSDKRVKFSGGQTRLVDIATILTLRDLQNKFQNMTTNLLLFDEIFDSLDDENIGYVSKLLKLLSKDLCIVLISHRHFDSIEADEILRIGV